MNRRIGCSIFYLTLICGVVSNEWKYENILGFSNYSALKEIAKKYQDLNTSKEVDELHEIIESHAVDYEAEAVVLKLKGLLESNATECVVGLAATFFGVIAGETWALTLVDSVGKPGSGILRGNLNWPGDFKTCFTVLQEPPYGNRSDDPVRPFRGKYCMSSFNINSAHIPIHSPVNPMPPMQVGLCVPDHCTAGELRGLLQFVTELPFINKFLNVSDVVCIPEKRDFWVDTQAWIALCICVLFGLIIGFATLYDLYLKYVKYPKVITTSARKNSVENTNGNFITRVNGAESSQVQGDYSDDDVLNHEHKTDVDSAPFLSDNNLQNPLEKSLCAKIILSFSAYSNVQKLLSLEPRKHNLGCLNGIRVLSLLWIIFAQTFVYGAKLCNNLLDVVDVTKTLIFQLVIQAVLAIDTFFLLSGILVAYLYFKHREENDWNINWVMFYVRRYWRLTPVYLLFIFVIDDSLINYLTNGPYWPQNGFEGNNCKENWWWNVLYINNFISSKDVCLQQSWFMANEMQFFVFCPVILILLTWYAPLAIVLSGLVLLASWIASGVVSSYYKMDAAIDVLKLVPGTDNYYNAIDRLYNKPFFHCSAYIIGLLCGWLLFESKCRLQLKRVWAIVGWILSAACCLVLVTGLYHTSGNISVEVASAFNSLSRTAWALGVSWVIFACSNGYGGIINFILGHPIWQPLSRLSYCAFLLHYLVISVVFCSNQTALHFDYLFMTYYSAANTIIIYVAAMVLSLVFEMPFLELSHIKSRRRV